MEQLMGWQYALMLTIVCAAVAGIWGYVDGQEIYYIRIGE